jgi:uncharacterized protein DUF6982/PilZ domain-containing protein
MPAAPAAGRLALGLLGSGKEFPSNMATSELKSLDPRVLCLADSIFQPYEDSERRGHLRLGRDDVRWLRSARLKYGPDVRVIDISAGGILVETDGQLRPDSNIVFELSGPTTSVLVPSKVLRCRVAAFADVMRYEGACVFKRTPEIPELVKQALAKNTPAPVAGKTNAVSWQKVVARFLDGRLVRGYTADFHPSKPQLHLSAEPYSNDTLLLALPEMKALFFVRDFAGDQTRIDRNEFGATGQGRKVSVTFHDGETLMGTTLNYRGEGNGFFVQPADSRSNNLRVFVAPGAAQHVRFL